MAKFSTVAATFGLVVAVPFLWWSWTSETMNPPAPKATPEQRKISDARFACSEYIKELLHDPDSADWGMNSGHWYVAWPARLDGDTVTVQPQFRATNGFGATVLTQWICEISITDTEWTLISLKEI